MIQVQGRTEPRVSIVIPNYNHGDYLSQAIESALAQTYPQVEVIVVDDGSTDHSAQVLARYADRVRCIHQENAGLSAARNTGLDLARGDYVALLDADDMLEPDYLQTLVPILEKDPGLGGVYCGYRFVDQHGRPLPEVQSRVVPSTAFYDALLGGNFLVPESMLLRRRCYQEAGPFDTALTACEDWDMWLRVARREQVVGTSRVLSRHRVLSGSMSSDPARMIRNRLQVLAKHLGPPPTEVTAQNRAIRRAYGKAYLSAAVEHLQGGDRSGAVAYLAQMARLYPEGFEEVGTFYELGCGDQPKGYRGHFPTLPFRRNRAIAREMLQALWAEPGLRARRGAVQAASHLALAMLAYGVQEQAEARGHLLQAVRSRPDLLGRGMWWRLFLRCLLSPELRDRWRSRHHRAGRGQHALP